MAVKQIVKRALLKGGVYKRRLLRQPFPGLAILCYHGIRPRDATWNIPFKKLHVRVDEFESHCRLLRALCNPVSLEQLRLARFAGAPLPDRAVLVTFDDGYASVATYGVPILNRYDIPAVVFTCTEPIRMQTLFWHDAVALACGEGAVHAMKELPFEQWRSIATRTSCRAIDCQALAPLTEYQVRELAGSARVEVGAHTMSHPILKNADVGTQFDEITGSKSAVEKWIGRSTDIFAYPNGQCGFDYDQRTVSALNEAGFSLAFTTNTGFTNMHEADLELSRFVVLAGISASELAHRLSFSWPR